MKLFPERPRLWIWGSRSDSNMIMNNLMGYSHFLELALETVLNQPTGEMNERTTVIDIA